MHAATIEARHSALRVNGARLWERLAEMALVGGTPEGGCNRQALTDADRDGRNLFLRWCGEVGCTIRIDRIGNIFVRREGRVPNLAPVLAGSHLDTQPSGGRFDGVYGVLAALEALATFDEAGIVTERAVEVAVWTNEEGARFSPAMLGSGTFAGVFSLTDALAQRDKEGISVGDELKRIGFDGQEPCGGRPPHAAFELHIEQGPVLESAGRTIGIVTGVQGIRWFDVVLSGTPAHAGPTPMADRRDPVRALPSIIAGLYELIGRHGQWGRVTFGDATVEPGARNTIPAAVRLAVDLRFPEETVLDDIEAEFRKLVHAAASEARVDGQVVEIWRSPAVRFDDDCVERVRGAADRLGLTSMAIVSGAGHDSVYLAHVAPTAMIFIPCAGGLSHNPAERASREDVEAGANVLLHCILAAAA
ncbi:MAG: Zn-dependent hydrolase [Sphingomonas sp.]